MEDFDALLKSWFADYTNGDLDKCVDLYDEQCKSIAPGGAIVNGKAAIKPMLQAMKEQGVAKMANSKMDAVTPLGDSYVLTTSEADAFDGDGKVVARYTGMVVWKKEAGKWLIFCEMDNDRK